MTKRNLLIILSVISCVIFIPLFLSCASKKETVSRDTIVENRADSFIEYRHTVDSLSCIIHTRDSLLTAIFENDSIHIHDSVSVNTYQRGDTVFIESSHWHHEYNLLRSNFKEYREISEIASKYRYEFLVDSVRSAVIDSISHIKEKEVKETKKTKPFFDFHMLFAFALVISLLFLSLTGVKGQSS